MPDEPASDRPDETQEERAIRSIRAIFEHGANPGVEALQLANEFTDRQVARAKGRLRRRGADPSAER